MRTTIELSDNAFRLAKAIAEYEAVDIGKVLGDTLLRVYGHEGSDVQLGRSEAGFPTFRVGRVITAGDVAEIEDC